MTIFFTIYCILFMIVCGLFNYEVHKEGYKNKNRMFYIYYIFRIMFVSFSMMGTFGYTCVVFCLHFNEDTIELHKDLKRNLQNNLNELVISTDKFAFITFIFFVVLFYYYTHQVYWQNLLDYSWASVHSVFLQREL